MHNPLCSWKGPHCFRTLNWTSKLTSKRARSASHFPLSRIIQLNFFFYNKSKDLWHSATYKRCSLWLLNKTCSTTLKLPLFVTPVIQMFIFSWIFNGHNISQTGYCVFNNLCITCWRLMHIYCLMKENKNTNVQITIYTTVRPSNILDH